MCGFTSIAQLYWEEFSSKGNGERACFFCFFFTRVLFAHWTSFKGVWSKLIINKSAIAYCSTLKTISYRKRYSISFLAVAGMSTFTENFWRRENPIQQNKPCAQDEKSTSITSITLRHFLINALGAALATEQVMRAPRLFILLM